VTRSAFYPGRSIISPMPLAAGERLGPYEILQPLGAGGMGEVYCARDTRLDRTVAIKILSSQLASNQQAVERFRRRPAPHPPSIIRTSARVRCRRRSTIPGDGTARGRDAAAATRARSVRSSRSGRHLAGPGRCTRCRALERHCPPRHQAGQHLPDTVGARRFSISAWRSRRPLLATRGHST
jgi:hypothetical protein